MHITWIMNDGYQLMSYSVRMYTQVFYPRENVQIIEMDIPMGIY